MKPSVFGANQYGLLLPIMKDSLWASFVVEVDFYVKKIHVVQIESLFETVGLSRIACFREPKVGTLMWIVGVRYLTHFFSLLYYADQR